MLKSSPRTPHPYYQNKLIKNLLISYLLQVSSEPEIKSKKRDPWMVKTNWWNYCSQIVRMKQTQPFYTSSLEHAHKQCKRRGKKQKNKWLTENQLGFTVSHPERESERCPPQTEGQMDPPICCVSVCQTGHQTSCTWVHRPFGSLRRPNHIFEISAKQANRI